MRLSYATTAQYVLPRSGSVRASKILFKILQPITDSPTSISISTSTPTSVNASRSSTPPTPPRVSFSNTPYTPSQTSPRSTSPPHTPPNSKYGIGSGLGSGIQGQTPTLNLDSILQRYPGFSQAERLVYPQRDCAKLIALLKESNTAYPKDVRVLKGLLTGWLQRG